MSFVKKILFCASLWWTPCYNLIQINNYITSNLLLYINLNGGADFYGESIAILEKEGAKSLSIFLEMCKERGIEPYKNFSGKFNVRITPEMHSQLNEIALSKSISLNAVVEKAMNEYITHSAN